MSMPAHVARSQHRVYDFRMHYYTEHGRRKERRVSLNTKDPVVARAEVIEFVRQLSLAFPCSTGHIG